MTPMSLVARFTTHYTYSISKTELKEGWLALAGWGDC